MSGSSSQPVIAPARKRTDAWRRSFLIIDPSKAKQQARTGLARPDVRSEADHLEPSLGCIVLLLVRLIGPARDGAFRRIDQDEPDAEDAEPDGARTDRGRCNREAITLDAGLVVRFELFVDDARRLQLLV